MTVLGNNWIEPKQAHINMAPVAMYVCIICSTDCTFI